MSVLLVTSERDITTDYIVLELERRGIAYARLNTESIARSQSSIGIRSPSDWRIEVDDQRITGEDVTSAYFRRPSPPKVPVELIDLAARTHCGEEWGAFLKAIYIRLEGKWLSSPFAIIRAEDKPSQLMLATEIGFDVPSTIITNALQSAQSIYGQGNVIGKPIRNALIKGSPERVAFTTRLPDLTDDDQISLSYSPVIFQREIEKAFDVRATVVGDKVFAATIASQDRVETSVDWRRGTVPDLDHQILALPSDISDRCVALVKRLNLRFGAIDLILDTNGKYWFLELNPNGQWAWIENRTGLPIAAAIVDELVGAAK